MDKTYTLQNLKFEWDEEKYLLNLRKHGVTFEEAAEVFFNEFGFSGDASVEDESRTFIVGFSFRFHLLYTVFVDGQTRTRIISAGRASESELRNYVRRK